MRVRAGHVADWVKGCVRWKTAGVLTFSSFQVPVDALIVVHFNSSSTCNPQASSSETTDVAQFPQAAYPYNYDTAYDWYTTTTGLVSTTNVLTLYDSQGVMMDAVLLSDGTTPPASATQAQADSVAAAGQWQAATVTGPDFITYAVQDLNATRTSPIDNSIQRLNNSDHNDLADWTAGAGAAETWGVLNAGQAPMAPCVSSGSERAPTLQLRLEAMPGVSPGPVRFHMSRSSSSPGRLAIYDATGGKVRTLWMWPGATGVAWDGRDEAGHDVPPGSYFARVVTPHASAVTRVTILR